jgi:hypothetical protein
MQLHIDMVVYTGLKRKLSDYVASLEQSYVLLK